MAGALRIVDCLQRFNGNALFVNNVTFCVGHGNNASTQLLGLLNCVNGNIAGTMDNNRLAFKGVARALQMLGNHVNQAVTGGFGAGKRAAELQALAGQNARPLVHDALVLAKQVGNFAAAYTQVTSGNVGVRSNVAIQLGHERLAEAHDLVVGLALRIKVRTALAAAHGQGGQGVLQNLLKTQELQHAQVDGGVETQAAFVGSNGAVELNAIAAVYLRNAGVVNPGNAEDDNALGFNEALQDMILLVFGMCFHNGLKGFKNFGCSLDEQGLLGVFCLDHFKNVLYVTHFNSFCTKYAKTLAWYFH